MKIELISFKLCPFAQRAIILLKAQNIDYQMNYINPMDTPNWFKKISPTGQVPLLKVDDKIVFESSVITEFINDIGGGNMHPSDDIIKANNRSWIAFSSTMFDDLFNIITGDEEKFNLSKKSLFNKLEKIEQIKNNSSFFNGDKFKMIDAAFAPIFMRINWINKFTNNAISLEKFTKLNNWSGEILALDFVKNSVVEGLDDVYYSNIENREGFLSTLLVD